MPRLSEQNIYSQFLLAIQFNQKAKKQLKSIFVSMCIVWVFWLGSCCRSSH